MRYDIAIIGTGPAGVSAALTAKNRNKNIILLGSRGGSDKICKTHRIVNYPGLANISGEDLNQAFLDQLKEAGIGITDKRVAGVYAMGDYFTLQAGADYVEADTVILTTGVSFGRPLPGENENLGRGVSYCATCDAPLYKGKETIVVGWNPGEETEAAFLSETCSKVTYIPMYKGEVRLPDKVRVLSGKPVSIEKTDGKMRLNLAAGAAAAITDRQNPTGAAGTDRQNPAGAAEGSEDGPALRAEAACAVKESGDRPAPGAEYIDAACIFLLRESVAPDKLVPGLELDGNHVKVDRNMATNLPGFFAAGDLTGLPYQISKAAGEGNIAALSAVRYLDRRPKE